MREAILEELGLMPLWQLRRSADETADAAAPALGIVADLTVVSVSHDNGLAGWILLDEALSGDEMVLFANLLQAMRLRQAGIAEFAYAGLPQAAEASQTQWVWVMGVKLAQQMLENDLPAVELVRQSWRWQGLPLFASARPRELILHPQDKAGLWAGWCGWLAAQ
ncbi:MAG: hypothetical protein P4L77_13840 [Sulfuriferula sp.]|nr:hypothetical protein [Sulfuriferula sp.]